MIGRQFSFFAPALVMSAWATVMLHTIASGHINRLLSPMFRSYVLGAAILLMVLSALYLFLYEPSAETPKPALAPTGRLRQLGRWMMLLIPVIAASVLSPAAFSSSTLEKRGLDAAPASYQMPTWSTTGQTDAKAVVDSDPNQLAPVEVTDLITISKSPSLIKGFDGRKVHVVGLFNNSSGNLKLYRMIMWCCAADAQPMSIALTGNTTGDWKNEQWLEIVGTARFPSTLGHVVPQVEVESIKATQEPDEPFLSP